MGGSSKGAGAGGSSSYDYYGTICVGLGEGPIDALVSILEDGLEIWHGPLLRSGASNPSTIAITGRGNLRLYWGTSDQPVDSGLNSFETQCAFKDRAYIIADDFLFGRERTTSPNWEFVMQRAPRQSLVTGSPAALDANGQANLVAFCAEILTQPTGLGLSLDRFYAPSWQAVAEAIDTDAERAVLACSPRLTDSQATLADIFQTFGEVSRIWARRRADGTIELGRWTPPADPATTPLLTANDFAEELEFDTADMDALPTEYTISFTDGDRLYKDATLRVPDLAAGRMAVEPITENISHPEITHLDQARAAIAQYMRQRRGGALTGTAQIRRAKAIAIRPGDYFRLDIDTIPGGAGLAQLVRCTGRSFGPTGPIGLDFQSEPGSAPVPFVPAWGDNSPGEAPAIGPLAYQRSISLPPAPGEEPTITILAARPADDAIGAEILYDDNYSAGTFPSLGHVRGFGLPVTLPQTVSNSASTIRVCTFAEIAGNIADRDRWLLENGDGATQTAARDDTLLLVLIKKNPSTGVLLPNGDLDYLEICAISAISLVSADTWDLTVLRGRMGTTGLAFDTTGGISFPDGFSHYEGWVIPRASLDKFTHSDFATLMRAGNPGYFRFRPYSRWAIYDPALAYEAGLQANTDWTTWAFTWPIGYDVPLQLGYTIMLSSEAHTVACASDGTPNSGQLGAGSTAATTISVYRGETALTPVASSPADDEFSIAIGTCTNTTATKVGNDTARCDTLTADTGTIAITVNVAGAFTVTKVFTLTKAKAGATGQSGQTGQTGAQGAQGIAGLDGSTTFYSASTSVPTALRAGDLWFVTNLAYELRRATAAGTSNWVKTLDASSTFEIISGVTYIKKAAIREVDAGVLIAGEIKVALSLGVSYGGSLSIGAGANRFYASSAGTIMGDPAGVHFTVASAGGVTSLALYSGATAKGSWTFTNNTITLDMGDTANSIIQSLGQLASQFVKAYSGNDPHTIDAPLYTAGGAWIAKSLDVGGSAKIVGAVGLQGLIFADTPYNNIRLLWSGVALQLWVDSIHVGDFQLG